MHSLFHNYNLLFLHILSLNHNFLPTGRPISAPPE
jgi:hypothetical protein